MVLAHSRELIAFLPLSDLYTDYAEHERLTVFANKGLECVVCDRRGTFLVLSRQIRGDRLGSVHVDLYTDDFVLMTVDHIVPKYQCKALGWSKAEIESLDNKQPMCDPCNSSKGHKMLTIEEMKERRRNTNSPRTGIEIIRQLVPNIHQLLGDRV